MQLTTGTALTTGLRAQYYDNRDLTTLRVTRTDGTVDFNWGLAAPSTVLGADTFSVRWSGQVQANYSQRYTFYTQADDGVRLWVNGRLLINNWTDHAVTENQGSLDLVAGQRYSICLEYYDNLRSATCKLLWSSASQIKEIIPQRSLFDAPINTDAYTFSGKDILKNGQRFTARGVNAMHTFGGESSGMNVWNVNTVREFVGNFRDTPLSGGAINVQGTWLHSLESIVQDNRANRKVTILCPFGWDGTNQTMFTGKNPSQTAWWNDYLTRFRAVANHFKNQSDVWFEVWNEPYTWNRVGYSDDLWLSDMRSMISNIRSTQATNPIVIPGAEQGQGESVILRYGKSLLQQDARLVFDVHAYEKWLSQPQTTIESRLRALNAANLPVIFGELGPQNAGQLLDPKPFLAAAKAQNVNVLAWVWKPSTNATDANALFKPDGTLNNLNNFNWASAFQSFMRGV
jgi:mannan endo-1,4-beta-mannosidase